MRIWAFRMIAIWVTGLATGCNSGPENTVLIEKADVYIDRHEVTVAQFRKFRKETHYQTTADSIGWGASFLPSGGWQVIKGANWAKPDGKHRAEDHKPVTQVSFDDARAYCKWKGGRLPTAKEWDLAAGNNIQPGNIWQGPFPRLDLGRDGYRVRKAPVGQFAANTNGLYDMFGNVWEWTRTKAQTRSGGFYLNGRRIKQNQNQKGRIIKGGSFLCNKSVCTGYNPSDYQVTPANSGMNHLGFRCVYDVKK